jgi:hypothetical protein
LSLAEGEVCVNRFRLVSAGAGLLCLTASFAQAQAVTGKTDDDWRFGVTVYGWATSMSGSATARGNTVNINASIVDLFQKSSSLAAWDSYVEANKGRFGFYSGRSSASPRRRPPISIRSGA